MHLGLPCAHAERAIWLFASEVLSLTLDENKVVGIGEYEGVTGMWTLTCVLYAWGLVQDTIEAMHCKHHVMIKAMTSAETHTNSTSPKGVAITKRMPVSTHMIHEPTIEMYWRHRLASGVSVATKLWAASDEPLRSSASGTFSWKLSGKPCFFEVLGAAAAAVPGGGSAPDMDG